MLSWTKVQLVPICPVQLKRGRFPQICVMEAYYTDMCCYSVGAGKQAASSSTEAFVVGCTDGGSGLSLPPCSTRSRSTKQLPHVHT
jgi:hypothetical protein